MLTCCFRGARVSKTDEGDKQGIATDLVSDTLQANRPLDIQKETSKNENQGISSGSSSKHVGRMFQLSELAAATMNFKNDHCLGEGAFGNVYKGRLESTDQVLDLQNFETGEHALKHKHRRATLPMDHILFPFSNTTCSSFLFLSSAMAFASPAILSILSSSLRYAPNALTRLRSRSPYKIQIKKPTDDTA